jgi:phage protein D
MTLRRPTATLTIDGRLLTMPEAAAAALVAESGVDGLHDLASIVLGPLSPVLDVAAGASVEIAISPGDDGTEPVLTGAVERVRHVPWGTAVDVLATTAALDRLRVGRAYVNQTAGDIVRDLLGEAGLDAGEIDAGPTLGAYHVDERRSAWRHVRSLAALLGAELVCGATGEVHVRLPRTGTADHVLCAGAELLAWSAGTRQPPLAPADVGPFGAASEQGADAWSLIHHEPGGGGAHRLFPAIRDREAGSAIDEAATAATTRAGGVGRAVTTGTPTIRAGDLVELDDVDRASRTYRVLHARHQLDAGGLTTTLDLEHAA